MVRFSRVLCWFLGHKRFYFVSNSNFPKEHAYWCGRCGYESSDEADARRYEVPFWAVRYMDRRFA